MILLPGHHARHAPALVLAAVVALSVAACGGSGASPAASAAHSAAASAAAPSAAAAGEPPEPTAVPGGATLTPPPLPDDVSTTETAWGTILDVVPTTFPVFPGAKPAESPDEPVSGAWISSAGVDEVAAWYRDELEGLGYRTTGLSDPLEDGSRVLDSVADIPECRIQAAFRPAGELTMITVLYAAGCAGGEG